MHLDVLDLRNFYYRTALGRVLTLAGLMTLLVPPPLAIAVAQELPLDRAAVERCFDDTAPDTLEAACVGEAAEKCSKTPPLHQTTIDIWQCYVAEAEVWDEIAAGLEAHLRVVWGTVDKSNRDAGWDLESEGITTEVSFQRLILAERNYREAMCSMIYAANGPGSMKNIDAGRCRMQMASRWALKLRNTDDWSRVGASPGQP